MSPGEEPQIVSYSRPPLVPTLMCNLFGCKMDIIKEVDENHFYSECTRCGERQGFSSFHLEVDLDKLSLTNI